jgi:amidase
MGRAFSEGRLLAFAYDYEQATKTVTLPVTTPALASDQLTKD